MKTKVVFWFLFVIVYLIFVSFGQEEKKIQKEEIIYCEVSKERNIKEPLKMDVYHSYDSKLAKKAAIILVHGGGFGSGDKSQSLYVKMAHEIAKTGYYAFSVNYRLNMGKDTAITDVLKAVEWIKENSAKLSIDKKKIFIAGDSAGGAIAVNVAYNEPEQTKLAGCIDLWGGLNPVKPSYPHNPPWDQPIYSQPLSLNVPPTCIIHGTIDTVVPIQTSKDLSEELTSIGVYNELHILEGAKHYPETYAEQFIPIMLKFVDKVISGQTLTPKKEVVFKKQDVIVIAGLSEANDAGYKNMEIIQQAAKKFQENKVGKIVFPKGIYPISCVQGERDFEDIMTEKIPQRTLPKHTNMAMAFSFMNNITIDGQGSTLIFSGLVQPFDFQNCKNVVVQNLNIDWKRPLFSEGLVKLVKNDMLEVEIFPEYPMKGKEPILSFQTFSPETGHLTGVCPFTNISSCELVGSQLVRFKSKDARLVKEGDIVIIRHMYNYKPGFNLFNCDGVNIRNVNIYALPGMSVFGSRTRNITLKHFSVQPSGNRIMSGNVDATHFISCTGTIEIDSCYFEGMGDDATNVHSFYYSIGEKIAENALRVFVSHSYAPNEKFREYPDVNDKLEFIRKSTLSPYNSAYVVSADYNDITRETIIKFDRPLPKDFEMTDLIANLSKHAKLKFTNNVVRDVRGRGILVQTRGALIENNSFEYCTGQGIHVDTAYPWMESIGTNNVVIRRNKFINCGYGYTGYCDAQAVTVETEADKPFVGIHRDLTIENNLVIGHTKPAFYLSCIDGVKMKNNRIISNTPAVWIEYGANIEISGNNFGSSKVETGLNCSGIAIYE